MKYMFYASALCKVKESLRRIRSKDPCAHTAIVADFLGNNVVWAQSVSSWAIIGNNLKFMRTQYTQSKTFKYTRFTVTI